MTLLTPTNQSLIDWSKKSHLFRLTLISLLIAQSLALFLLEGLIPLPFLAPGAKLGLANIVTVIALYILPSTTDVILIISLRTILATFFGGGPSILLYSLAGGLCSLMIMKLIKNRACFSLIGVSCAGGLAHNLAQLVVASIIVNNWNLFYYLTILGPCGLITGFFIGILGRILVTKITAIA